MLTVSSFLTRIVFLMVLTGIPAAGQLDSLDPAEDGWDSEAFGTEIGIVLENIQNHLTKSEKLDNVAGKDFAATPLLPTDLHTVSRPPYVIRRAKNLTNLQSKPGQLESALLEITTKFDQNQARRTYIKTVETTVQGATGQSRHLVMIAGPANRGRLEQNAEWLIDWQLPEEGSPRIRQLRLTQWEEVFTPASRQFEEITSAVIKHPDTASQLATGTDTWRARIENYLHIHLFGQRGLAVGDVNGDLRDDIYFCQPGGLPNRLLLHQPDGTAREAAADFGLDFLDNSRAALFADLDNDGDADLAITTHDGLLLLENENERRFVVRSSIPNITDGQSIVAADHDHNGFLDLYVCSYFRDKEKAGELALPVPYFDARNGGANLFLANQGNWQFTDHTKTSGLQAHNDRWSWAALWFDANGDGFSDLYVANDFGKDCLYLNGAGENGRVFRETAATAGLATGAFGMSVSAADYDGDQRLDLYVGNMFSSAGSRITRQPRFQTRASEAERQAYRRLAAGNSLFRHTRTNPPVFSDSSNRGPAVGRWSWSSLFTDINNDSWPDLLVANGYVTGTQESEDL